MSQNVTLSATISAAQSRRAVIETLVPRFPRPFTRVYKCSKYTPKTAISAIFQDFRRGLPAGRLAQQALQHYEIRHDLCWAGPS
jgi:hypothetical protein